MTAGAAPAAEWVTLLWRVVLSNEIRKDTPPMTRTPEYGSDVIVDLLIDLGIDYAAFNPGATFRGLHDSIVNYAGERPRIVECTHEEISVAIAHGYAKAARKPMAAVVHDVVGLQHATMAI